MIVVNMYGGPSSGKSTTAAGLFYFMKLQHLSVELVTEYAKSLVWSNRLNDMIDQQEYLFAKQNHMIHRLRGKVDYAIVDSPILLSCVYPKINGLLNDVVKWPAEDVFNDLVVKIYNTYDNMDIFLNRPVNFEEGGREHNLEQSKQIDDLIHTTLKQCTLSYHTIDTDDKTISTILDILGENNEKTTTKQTRNNSEYSRFPWRRLLSRKV